MTGITREFRTVREQLLSMELRRDLFAGERENFRRARMVLDLAGRSRDAGRIDRALTEGREWLDAYAGW